MRESLGHRSFTMQDQAWFAQLSGDNNPLHMGPIAARRTKAGVPVVHELHTLLWCIDQFAERSRYDGHAAGRESSACSWRIECRTR
jgi:acyl dehydratase